MSGGIVEELRWIKRVTEDDTTNIYGRTLDLLGECEKALARVVEYDPNIGADVTEVPAALAKLRA